MLYLITNRKLIKKGELYTVVEQAVYGGVDVIILREKDLSYKELLFLAMKIKSIIKGTKTSLIINGNLQVAKDSGAHGYHVSYEEFMKEKPDFEGIVGVSVHSIEEAKLAEKSGASYLLAGHVFETNCKKGLKPRGSRWIKEIKRQVSIPIIAIGGIKLTNIKEVLNEGANGVAVMSSIMNSKDPFNLTKDFKKVLQEEMHVKHN